jgi:uroporphyrinogen decarboxylase
MMSQSPFSTPVSPNWEGFIQCLSRRGEPRRVHNIELFLDGEVKDALCARYGIDAHLDRADPHFALKREIAIQRFLGYDYVVAGIEGLVMPVHNIVTVDTAGLSRSQGRSFIDQHAGPITSWETFEQYPWPNLSKFTTATLEWYQANLPDDMCLIGGLTGHFAENLSWIMGYETLCYKLYDDPALVQAMAERFLEIDSTVTRLELEFSRVRVIWGSDDMGFRSGTLISPKAMRQYVLPGHKALAKLAHDSGRLYILHSCGNLDAIMDDLIDDVRIDGKHSYEDTIHDGREAKRLWGNRMAILGGIDLDFLCQSDEAAVRQRTRDTLAVCQPGGGYCLGTGNSVANYIPLDNYLAMLDEGHHY